MGIIFPLSTLGRCILIIVAIFIGLIFSMLVWPDKWKKLVRKDNSYMKNRDNDKKDA